MILTIDTVLMNHVSDLSYCYNADGGGKDGLNFVNQGTCGTPYFENVKQFEEYIAAVQALQTGGAA